LAYIGTKPTIGNFQICDAISVVNGQAAYTMQVGSVNVSPQSANHMIVSLNGTIQKPNSSFTVSGSTITFASNLATGDVIDFIQILGDVLDLGVPSDATVTSAKLASDSVTSAKVADGVLQPPHRNIIINGDMSIAQRGTSTSSITSSGYHTADRYTTSVNSAGTWTQSQSTTVPTGQGFASSLKMDCTTANGSLSSSSNLIIQQKIEGQNLQYIKKGTSSAESLTLSFWVRSNKTGTYIAELFDEDNTRQYSQSYTISSADTWEKKTLTYAGDTTGTLGNDNAQSMRVNFWLSAGSDFTSGSLGTSWSANSNGIRAVGQVNLADSTSNEWYVTGVQLEVGSAASDFEFLPVDVNLQRCQRYFQMYVEGGNTSSKIPIALTAYGSNNATGGVPYYAEMRSSPSASHSNLTCNYGGGTTSITGISFYATAYASGMDITVTGQSWSTGRCVTIQYSATGAYMRFDAEL
jgi:hypothetical protein